MGRDRNVSSDDSSSRTVNPNGVIPSLLLLLPIVCGELALIVVYTLL